jgi:hypothetical protein
MYKKKNNEMENKKRQIKSREQRSNVGINSF